MTSHTPPTDNAANLHNGIAVDAHGNPIPAQVLPAFPVSHVQREKSNDDKEVRLIQGRMWLISFTDLFSILLCFFILMYSMKEPDFDRIAKMVGSDGGAYAGAGVGEAKGDQAGVGINRVEYGEALDLSYLEGVLRRTLQQAQVEQDVKIVIMRDHLKLVIADAQGERGVFVAKSLGERLTNLPNRISVIGMPARWSSGDWAGSVQMATVFAANMAEGGYRKGITVMGEGEGTGGIEIRVENDDGRLR